MYNSENRVDTDRLQRFLELCHNIYRANDIPLPDIPAATSTGRSTARTTPATPVARLQSAIKARHRRRHGVSVMADPPKGDIPVRQRPEKSITKKRPSTISGDEDTTMEDDGGHNSAQSGSEGGERDAESMRTESSVEESEADSYPTETETSDGSFWVGEEKAMSYGSIEDECTEEDTEEDDPS